MRRTNRMAEWKRFPTVKTIQAFPIRVSPEIRIQLSQATEQSVTFSFSLKQAVRRVGKQSSNFWRMPHENVGGSNLRFALNLEKSV
jgi:hypothetical protein